ncbi:MAG: CRTAC1 family protein [Polyangiales bacterium]
MTACFWASGAARAQPAFVDATEAAGLSYQHVTLPETTVCDEDADPSCQADLWSAGATVGDYNGDGCIDLFVTRYDASDLLFENNCDGTFQEVASLVGIDLVAQTNGALFTDIDNDGDLDLYVVTQRDNAYLLYVSDGAHLVTSGARPAFTEQASARGAQLTPDPNRTRLGMGVTAGDFDRDGYVDLFTTEWGAFGTGICSGSHARLLHNRGADEPGYFDDVTEDTGALMTTGVGNAQFPLSFSPAFPDLDDDGWQDLAVVSDGITSELFWNQGNGSFIRGAEDANVGTETFGMGSTFGDYDNDGDFDWFVTSIHDVRENGRDGNRLYRNDGGRSFTDVTDEAGVRDGVWGWGTAFFDYDNDGDLDLGMTNGGPVDPLYTEDPMRFWRNDGPGMMPEIAQSIGLTDTGQGRAFVPFDYDADGDLDLFVTRNQSSGILYRNDGGNDGDWLRVRAKGVVSPADGRGAKVTVTAESLSQVRQIGVGSHYLGEGDTVAHFGLGEGYEAGGGTVDVRVRFSSGRSVEMTDVEPNQLLVVTEPSEGLAPFESCVGSVIDCDDNGVIDTCDIAANVMLDEDGDGVIDTCDELESADACERRSAENGIPDAGVPDGGTNEPPPATYSSGCSIRAAGPKRDFGPFSIFLALTGFLLVCRCRYRRNRLTGFGR